MPNKFQVPSTKLQTQSVFNLNIEICNLFVICFLFFGICAQSALAQDNTFYNQGPAQDESAFFEQPSRRSGSIGITNPLAGIADDIPGLIGYILYLARWFAGAIAVLMIVVGAYQILFSAGDPKEWQKGRQTIIWAMIGFAIVLLAEVVVDIIRELVG
ncbi:MAG: pilin [Patescibacteria group bacterium]